MSIFSLDILIFDYIIICLSLVITIFSFWKGFINSVLGLLTWVGSVFITIYTYEFLSEYLYNLIINFEFLSDFKQFASVVSLLISIPIIFLISLFILKRIRKVINSDLDKKILGLIIDKFFGAIYGIVFTYLLYSSILYFTNNNNLRFINNFNLFLTENSSILNSISTINLKIIDNYINNNNEN